MLSKAVKAALEIDVRRANSEEPFFPARKLFEHIIKSVREACDAEVCDWEVEIETDKVPGSSVSSFVCGLVIQTARTHVIPVTTTQNVVRLGDVAFYTSHPNAATDLLDAVLGAVRDTIAADGKESSGRKMLTTHDAVTPRLE